MPNSISGSDSFPGSFDVPSGGDRRNAASVNPAFEALADRTTYLKNRQGLYRMLSKQIVTNQSWMVIGQSDQTTFGTGDKQIGVGIDVQSGDIVEVQLSWSVASSDGSNCEYRIGWSLNDGEVLGSTSLLDVDPQSLTPATLHALTPVEADGILHIWLQQRRRTYALGMYAYSYAPFQAIITVYRVNT